jgi:putative transposase
MKHHRNKTSYHPFILIAFYLNCLPEDILQIIPRSTQFDWHHRDIENSFGHQWYQENKNLFSTLQMVVRNRKLLRINKALLRIIAINRFIKKHLTEFKSGGRYLKIVVVNNIQKVSLVVGMKQALKYLNVDFQYYAKLKRKINCSSSLLDLCRIKHPAQLLQKEIETIKCYCADHCYLHWPLSSLYHQIKKDGSAFFCISTFYKYVQLLKLQRRQILSRRKNHCIGIRASKPLEILHADMTLFSLTDNTKAYIYLIQDNYSRAILSFRTALAYRAQYVFENIKYVYEKFIVPSEILYCNLVTDDGSENHGEVENFINSSVSPEIRHLIAQKTIIQSNSMIEAANKQIKYRFLYHQNITTFQELEKYVCRAVEDYNKRPHDVLNGLSPFEVLNGKLPSTIYFAKQISDAKAVRLIENKKIKCCTYSF